jgi:hypothetical protein
MAARTIDTTPVDEELSTRRLNIMRVGYAFMGVGLVIVKWPILLQGAAPSLPVFEGVVACLLTAMSLLAFLGLRYCSTVPSSSSSSPSSRGDTPGSATPGHPGTRGVDECPPPGATKLPAHT